MQGSNRVGGDQVDSSSESDDWAKPFNIARWRSPHSTIERDDRKFKISVGSIGLNQGVDRSLTDLDCVS